MLSMMKKALHLEGVRENDTLSEDRWGCSQKTERERGRPSSPISQFRYIEDDDELDDDCNHQEEHLSSVDSQMLSLDRRDEEDEEHHPLSFFFRPVEQTGNWNSKIEREIEAAKRAASISIVADLSHIENKTSNFTQSNNQMMNFLKDAIRNPSARSSLRPSKGITQLENSRSSSVCGVLVDSDVSSLFRLRQFVIEHDDLGEGVSVQTSLTGYEDEKKKYFPNPCCSPGGTAESSGINSDLSRTLSDSFDDVLLESLESSNKIIHQSEPEGRQNFEEKKDDDIRLEQNEIQSQNKNFVLQHADKLLDANDDIPNCLSATESDVDSVDGLPSNLQSRWLMGESPKEQMLASLDGIQVVSKYSAPCESHRLLSFSPINERVRESFSADAIIEKDNNDETGAPFEFWPFNLLCGKESEISDEIEGHQRFVCKQSNDVPLALLDCANIIYQEDRMPVTAPAVPTSLIRVANESAPLSYAETLLAAEVDPRMQDWIGSQFKLPGKPPKDGTYNLGKSRTVIVHEIARGAWTWCTEWSPDGSLLAVATENHHLAVIDTTASTVWRVRHDQRIKGPVKNHTTHSIRAISWGHKYIAIGGTGNAVSILLPTEPYSIIHTITGTGFVGTLDWREKSNILAFGSRLDKVTIVRISSSTEESAIRACKQTESHVLDTIILKHWANSVKFCPNGSFLAVGDAGGVISVYKFSKSPNGNFATNMIAWFPRRDSILCLEWSPEGKWLYAGGEDRCVTVIDCAFWEIIHKKGRERWVQCIASSHSGSHLAVGGVSSEISLLDTQNGWDSVIGVELKGLVPLSASWHPKDQYLALTGQNNSILVVETTNARHVKGHHLYSVSPILVIEFSPDGRMAIIGNQAGVVTFFALSGTTFITVYELIVTLNKTICARWSQNGTFAVIGGKDAIIIVGRKKTKRQGKKTPPNLSGFSVRKVIRDFGETHAVSIDFRSQYIAVSGSSTRILDARADFSVVKEWSNGPYNSNAWSPDGRWFAMIGEAKLLTIYDTSERIDRWRPIFSMKCDFVGLSLAWGPSIVGGLLYLAYGGTSNEVFIMEIRTREGTWESVLRIPRDGPINALDWSIDGLLAAAIGNGTVGIIDLGYLQSGVAVNEMDYNWQRQALTCFTEVRRNRGRNSMKSIRWLPAAPGSDLLLAVGGTDGELEILDLTERRRCRGYASST